MFCNCSIKANNEADAYSLLARGLPHSRLGDDRRAAEDFSRVIELEPDNAEALENRALPATTWVTSAWPGKTTTPSSGWNRKTPSPSRAGARAWPNWETWPGQWRTSTGQSRRVRATRSHTTTGVAPTPRWGTRAGPPEDFDQAIALDPANPTFYHYRGMAHRELREFDQAVGDFDIALRLEPLSNPSRYARGVARVMRRDYDGATPDFDAVLDLDPDNTEALNGRGVASSGLENDFGPNVREGLDSVRQKRDPNFPSAR